MKKNILLLAGLVTLCLFSCKKEEQAEIKERGYLSVRLALAIDINEIDRGLKATAQTEHFKVSLYYADGELALQFDSAAAMPDTIFLEPGDYYIEAHSDNDLPAEFENPYYFGRSEIFSISPGTTQTVTLTCSLANTIVSVVYSDSLRTAFSGFSTTVSSEAGSLVFAEDEIRPGYFRTLPLDITVDLTWTDHEGTINSKSLYGRIPDPQPNRHYEIHVNASPDNGLAMFEVLLDESEVPVEVVEIGRDSVIIPEGNIAYGDLLVTEIMANPSAMSDTYGEWFELYNNSDHVINLQNLVINRDSTNFHTIGGDIALAPGEHIVLSRTDTATDASSMYVYGSDILLPNTGAVLGIYNEDTGDGPGSLIFEVDYGSANFPEGTGASVSLDPGLYNAADAVLGTSWCVSVTTYSTGDAGTPGEINDACL